MQRSEEISLPESGWMRTFRRRLIAWYARNRRALPWRGARDPYAVWVSEIMLQQTTTQTVRGYYGRFLERFPTIAALAAADLGEVHRLWEGLGYYRRAAQMHRAAREIVERYGGVFPREYEAVLGLPGIGRYTAGAILSIAWDLRLPILEANTIRLYARLLGYSGDTVSREGQRLLWAFAEQVLPSKGKIGEFNQAMMDLGSQVCTPSNPACSGCPAFGLCAAAAEGLQGSIPPPGKKTVSENREEIAVLIRRRGRFFLQRQPAGARWAGLWDFPKIVSPQRDAGTNRLPVDAIARSLSLSVGFPIAIGKELLTHRHTVTRFRIVLRLFEGRLSGGRERRETFDDPPTGNATCVKESGWFSPYDIERLALNSPARKIRAQIPRRP